VTNTDDPKNKVVVVTGAASGIGRAIALRAAQDGHTVIVADIQEPAETVEAISSSGGTAIPHLCDVRDSSSVESLFATVRESFGHVDILINNAGTMGRWPLSVSEMTESDWHTVFETNVKGVFLCCKHALPQMRERRSGVIVNIGSELAFVGAEGCSVYCASKAAVVHLTRSMAIEEAQFGIRINSVCPGPVDTEMLTPTVGDVPTELEAETLSTTALKRLGRPEEIAEVVWFAASEGASFMIGSALLADGGVTAM